MIIASFLDWASSSGEGFSSSVNGWDLGMLGLWQTIIGGVLAAVGLIGIVGRADLLPKEVAGFDFEQALVVLVFPVLLWNFGLQFDDVLGDLGLFVGWIAAAIAIGGAELQRRMFQGR